MPALPAYVFSMPATAAPFNSLFEMPRPSPREPFGSWLDTFNSLFEMHLLLASTAFGVFALATFNSLFEMRGSCRT